MKTMLNTYWNRQHVKLVEIGPGNYQVWAVIGGKRHTFYTTSYQSAEDKFQEYSRLLNEYRTNVLKEIANES